MGLNTLKKVLLGFVQYEKGPPGLGGRHMGRRRKLLVRCGRPEQLRDDFFTSGRTRQLFAAPDVKMENLGVWNAGDLIANSL